MDSYNFMTFSIDQKVNCIEWLRESWILMATEKSIVIYDLGLSEMISSCRHQIGRKVRKVKETLEGNQQSERQAKKDGEQQEQTLRALQMHYFPSYQWQQQQDKLLTDKLLTDKLLRDKFLRTEDQSNQQTELDQNQNEFNSIQFEPSKLLSCWEDQNQRQNNKTIGYLLVHYKLIGLSTYKVQQTFNNQNQFILGNNSQPTLSITFVSHLPVNFGSAFLKLSFLSNIYHQTNAKSINLIKEKYLSTQNSYNTQSLQQNILTHLNLTDFILKKNKKTNQFLVFQNDNELFQINRLSIDNQGKLSILQSIQIDQQTAKLNSSTVTAINHFQYRYQSSTSSFLIMAMEPGTLCLYNLPQLQRNSPNSQHYIQPIKVINVKKYLRFQPKIQDLDYSVTSIQLLHQSMALVLVRNCGILLLNLKDFTFLQHLSLNITPDKNYFFTDTRLIAPIHSDIIFSQDKPKYVQQKVENTKEISLKDLKELSNSSKVQTTLVIANKNTLKKLFLQLNIHKIQEPPKEQGANQFKIIQKVQITKTKCTIIEQINTPLIEDLLIINHQKIYQNHSNSTNPTHQTLNQEIQVFGNYQNGKILYFTP